MKGYIITNNSGDYLSSTYFWFPHESASKAWVHPSKEFDCSRWEIKPAFYYEAKYSVTEGEKSFLNAL